MCNILDLYNSASKLSSSSATMSLFPYVTCGRHEIDHTSSSGIQLKNGCSYSSTPHTPSWHTEMNRTPIPLPLPSLLPRHPPAIHITHINHTHIHTVCFHVGVRLSLLGPEDESNMILQNTRNHSTNKMMLHYRRWGFPAALV